MAKKNSPRLPTLDLHGKQTSEVFDLLDVFLRKESEKGTARVRIMPGKGTGKVRDVTLDYLKKAHYPWQFEKLDNGSKNEGVLIVFLE